MSKLCKILKNNEKSFFFIETYRFSRSVRPYVRGLIELEPYCTIFQNKLTEFCIRNVCIEKRERIEIQWKYDLVVVVFVAFFLFSWYPSSSLGILHNTWSLILVFILFPLLTTSESIPLRLLPKPKQHGNFFI